MTRFERAMEKLAVHEGGYSDHPRDPGGATMKGVTQRVYDSYRRRIGEPQRHVKEITDNEVYRIYRQQYWNKVNANDLPEGVAYCVFDAAVNSGPGRAARWLQKTVGAKVDGVVGNETIGLTREMDPVELIVAYCDRRLAFMKRLKHWNTFRRGWTRRVQEVRAQSTNWAKGQPVPKSTETVTAKAGGEKNFGAKFSDVIGNKNAIGAGVSMLGSAGSLASGQGPIQYALAGVLIIGALTAVWWLVTQRDND